MRKYITFLCTAAGVLLLSTTAAGQMRKIEAQGPYIQAATGMVFPTGVGDFQRVNIIQYSPDGTDMSAGYNRMQAQSEIVATVYVFPSPPIRSFGSPDDVIAAAREMQCKARFNGLQREVTTAHPDAELLSTSEVELMQGGAQRHGYLAVYKMSVPNFFGRTQTTHSEAYLFCYAGGQWAVEYRIDYPENYNADVPISEFMHNLIWTIPEKP